MWADDFWPPALSGDGEQWACVYLCMCVSCQFNHFLLYTRLSSLLSSPPVAGSLIAFVFGAWCRVLLLSKVLLLLLLLQRGPAHTLSSLTHTRTLSPSLLSI